MAGHSKWANIQYRKKAQDAKRGKLFTKLIREITISSRAGGPDAGSNPRLRAAVDKALGANMTRDTIDRAIKRGAGDTEANNMEELRYEGYGLDGVAIIIDTMTDNRNRTITDIRTVFKKRDGNLGAEGSVAYLFTKQGQLFYPPGSNEDAIVEASIEAGAEDVEVGDDKSIMVITTPESFGSVQDAMRAAGFAPENAEVTMVAGTTVTITDAEKARDMLNFIDALEDLDDVQGVYTNMEIPDEVREKLE